MYVDTGGQEANLPNTTIAVIDTHEKRKVHDIEVQSARVEAIQFERNGSRMFANLRTKGQVGVFDKKDYKVLATWPITDAGDNVPMALDEADHRLFVVTRKPAKLVVFDTAAGKELGSITCVPLADDMWFDPGRKRIYVSGDGFLGVYGQKDSDHYEEIAKVPTGFRAKVSIFVPELNRLYVASVAKGTQPAKLFVFDVK
jgi:DNA-binding beta-propeller fold protein YncE